MHSAAAHEPPEGTANGGESSDGESSTALHMPCYAESAPALPKLPIVAHRDAEEDGALGQRKEFDASTRVLTRACTDVAAPPTSQMKGCVEIMYRLLRAAGEENLYH